MAQETCGLLLMGLIENFINEPSSLEDYLEKRHHDAVNQLRIAESKVTCVDGARGG